MAQYDAYENNLDVALMQNGPIVAYESILVVWNWQVKENENQGMLVKPKPKWTESERERKNESLFTTLAKDYCFILYGFKVLELPYI